MKNGWERGDPGIQNEEPNYGRGSSNRKENVNVRYEGDIPCITSGLTQKEKGGHQVGRLLY